MNALTEFNIDFTDKEINIKAYVCDMKADFVEWDEVTKLNADRLLYKHLQKCYALALACQAQTHVKMQLEEFLKAEKIKMRKDNSVFSPILLYLFPGDENRRRRSAYNSVMLEAEDEGTKGEEFTTWVENNKGLEDIRIKRLARIAKETGKAPKAKKKKKRKVNVALREKAQSALTKKQPLIASPVGLPTTKQEGEFVIVVCKVSGNGTVTIVDVVDDETAEAVLESVGDKLPDPEIVDEEGRTPIDVAVQKAAENHARREQ